MKLTLTEQLVLGIVAERSLHGFDIEKLINERGMRKWTDIGFSSIYYVLDKLEAKGLAISSEAKGKAKKQYSVTPQGVAALKEGAVALIAERRPTNTHIMTGLAASYLIEGTELTGALIKRREQLTADLTAIHEKQQVLKAAPHSARRLIDLSETLLEAELNWVHKEIE
jgi:DNA-binding PadR family transcriptional regulator